MRVTNYIECCLMQETINEADEDKVHFNYFKDYF